MDDMKTKIMEIQLEGLTWDGVREIPYNNRRIRQQLKLAAKIKGHKKIKSMLYTAIEEVGNSSYVNLIENLVDSEEE